VFEIVERGFGLGHNCRELTYLGHVAAPKAYYWGSEEPYMEAGFLLKPTASSYVPIF
jgi:hypothetical protein